MAIVSYFFDCATAESYLGAVRLGEAALRTGATIDWRPVLPEDLPSPAPRSVAELRYATKDLADWARFCGVRVETAGAPAAESAAAARLFAVLAGHACLPPAIAAWFAGVHGGKGPDLASVARAAGRDPGVVEAALGDPEARARLAANAASLMAAGGWRCPSFTVGGALFVGLGRLSLVELALTEASEQRIIPPGAHSQSVASRADVP